MPKNKILFIPMDGTKPRIVDEEPQADIDRRKAEVKERSEQTKKQRLAKRPSTIDWDRIEKFIGFGNIQAPLVFVGMEEGLKEPDALHQDLLWRSTFDPVMDAKRAHEGLVGGPELFSENPRRQPTWRVMADVMLHFNGERFKDKADRSKARKEYRPKALGRSFTNALLIELLPYPNTNTATWFYKDRFPTREAYAGAVLPKRLTLISRTLAEYPREAIVCYGQSDWDVFKRLFPDVQWQTVKGQYNTFECATWRGAKVTLVYHFSRFFNTDDELDELCAMALPAVPKENAKP